MAGETDEAGASAAMVTKAGAAVTSGGRLRVQLRGFKDPVEAYDIQSVA